MIKSDEMNGRLGIFEMVFLFFLWFFSLCNWVALLWWNAVCMVILHFSFSLFLPHFSFLLFFITKKSKIKYETVNFFFTTEFKTWLDRRRWPTMQHKLRFCLEEPNRFYNVELKNCIFSFFSSSFFVFFFLNYFVLLYLSPSVCIANT